MDTFNLQNLALAPTEISPTIIREKKTPPRHRTGEKFLKGPIPLNWLSRASQLKGKSLQVGLSLWFLAGLTNSKTVKLPQSTLCEFGVNRQCKYRALQWLEDAKLISVKVDVGQAPLVTLRDVMEE
jgi:hypothetical protein